MANQSHNFWGCWQQFLDSFSPHVNHDKTDFSKKWLNCEKKLILQHNSINFAYGETFSTSHVRCGEISDCCVYASKNTGYEKYEEEKQLEWYVICSKNCDPAFFVITIQIKRSSHQNDILLMKCRIRQKWD